MDERFIFIVGMARTGTTLVSRCLNKGGDVYILNETHLMRENQNSLGNYETMNDSDLVHKKINEFLTIQKKGIYNKSEYQDYSKETAKIFELFTETPQKKFRDLVCCLLAFEASARGKKRAGDQTPNHVFSIGQLNHFFPDSFFVNMVRDPRAVVLSQKFKWKAARRLNQPRFEVFRAFVNYHPITQSILWNRSVSAGIQAQTQYPKYKIKTFYYEDIVRYPEKKIIEICEFVDVPFHPDMLDTGISMSSNVLASENSGIDPSLADKWRDQLSSTEIFFVELFVKKNLTDLNYGLTNCRPNFFVLLFFIFMFPLHIFFAYLLNINRIKNPFSFLYKLFANNSRTKSGNTIID